MSLPYRSGAASRRVAWPEKISTKCERPTRWTCFTSAGGLLRQRASEMLQIHETRLPAAQPRAKTFDQARECLRTTADHASEQNATGACNCTVGQRASSCRQAVFKQPACCFPASPPTGLDPPAAASILCCSMRQASVPSRHGNSLQHEVQPLSVEQRWCAVWRDGMLNEVLAVDASPLLCSLSAQVKKRTPLSTFLEVWAFRCAVNRPLTCSPGCNER